VIALPRKAFAGDTPVLISDKPIDRSKRDDGCRQRKQLSRCVCQIEDENFADDSQQRNQDHGGNLHHALLTLGGDEQRRLNSRAMMTVKIAPNTVWKTE
jgi:hypothetical protein